MPERHFNDADVLSYATEQSYEISTSVYETIYEDISLAGLVPITTDFDEWSPGYGQLIGSMTGKADWQTTHAKDIPLADVGLDLVTAPFDEYSIGYQWTVGEIQKALRYGISLSDRRAAAARRGADEFQYDLAMTGTTRKGWTGLLNNALVTPMPSEANGSTGPTTAWVLADGSGNKTPEQIVAELNKLLMGPPSVAKTPGDLLSNRIALPALAYRYISTTPYGVTSPGDTIMTYFMRTNLYTMRTGQPIQIIELPQLATMASAVIVGGGRAISWRFDTSVMELPVPHAYRFYPVYQDGPFHYTVPGLARVGQLDLKLPGAVRYLDGITPVPT